MILSDEKIIEEVKNGNITISDFDPTRVNPNSYDLLLGDYLKVYIDNELDCKTSSETKTIEIPDEGFVLQPGELYLAFTKEIAGSSLYHPQLKGKSSLARKSLNIDCTASFGDVGFINNWTLELFVVKPLRIYKDMKICQIYFTKVYGNVAVSYDKKADSKYNGDNKAKESLYHLNYANGQ